MRIDSIYDSYVNLKNKVAKVLQSGCIQDKNIEFELKEASKLVDIFERYSGGNDAKKQAKRRKETGKHTTRQ